MHNNNKITNNPISTRDHQEQIGTPRGIIDSSNPNGYSAFQRQLMGSLHRIEMNNLKSIVNSNPNFLGGNNAVNNNDNNNLYNNYNINNGNFVTWNNVSLQPFNNNKNMINSIYKNMFAAASNNVPQSLSIQQIEVNSTILSPKITRKDPTRAETIDENDEDDNPFKSMKGGNVMSTACLHSLTIGDRFGVYVNEDRILRCRRSTTNKGKARYYCNLINWIESPLMHDIPQNYMHQGHDQFMMSIYMHNQVVFCANVFFPNKRNYRGGFYYDKHAFMNFRPKDFNLHNKPYGKNGHYSTSITNIHTSITNIQKGLR